MTQHAASNDSTETTTEAHANAQSHQDAARGVVRRHVYWTLGLGLVPVPLFDLVAVTGVQLKMIKELSDLYGVNFMEDKAKKIVIALAAGIGSLSLTRTLAGSVLKVIPGVGSLFGAVGVSVLGGAFTQAIGNVFTMHFESGGTLLDFDARKMRDHFRSEFEKSKESVKTTAKDGKKKGHGDSAP